MLPIFFLILSVALGASASSCATSLKGVHIDRQAIEGTWWIQVQYGMPPVTNSSCYNVHLSPNSDNRLNNLQSWKIGSKTVRVNTPEIAVPDNRSERSGVVYFQLTDGIEEVWFLKVDYNEYYAMYGCKNGVEPVFLITTKTQERNESRLNEIAESVAKIVPLPEGKHWTDNTHC